MEQQDSIVKPYLHDVLTHCVRMVEHVWTEINRLTVFVLIIILVSQEMAGVVM